MICSLLTLVLMGSPAQGDADVKAALRLLEDDPPIALVQKAALENFGVSQSDVRGYKAAARLRALVPVLAGSYVRDDSKITQIWTDRAEYGFAFDPDDPQVTDKTNGLGRAFTASATLNLRGLIFDANELEAYALVGIHEDVLKEVTRLYYTRQHNILALALEPPVDPRAKAALILRTRELEAMLDAMTGGAWSRLKREGR